MSDPGIAGAALLASCVVVAAGGAGIYVYSQTTPPGSQSPGPSPAQTLTTTPPPAGQAATALRDGSVYLMSTSGKYLSMKYDASKPAGLKCTGTLSTKADATKVMMTASGASWFVKPDCDKDGKHTSYLTNASRFVQPRVKKGTSQKWTVKCTGTRGCTFGSSGKYIAGSETAPVLGSTPVQWILERA
jgi:hypothetical protein